MQLLLFAISLIFYYVFHSVLADTKVKVFLMERWIPQRYYRLLFNITAIVLLFPIMYLYQGISTHFIFKNTGLKYFGLGIAVVGIFLFIFALSQYRLGEFSGTEQLRQSVTPAPESLKTTGFNGIVRHPLYFCGLLIIWGGFLYRPTYLYLVMASVTTAYLYLGTKLEEEKLVGEFGDSYLVYQKRVGMLLPFLV